MTAGMKRGILIFAVGVVLLVVGIGIGWVQQQTSQAVRTQPEAQSIPIGGPFTLVDENGATVTDQTYRGKWLLVFFGFTHCPDVCPTALHDIAVTLDQLGSLGDRIQPLFITVDPERDTPDFLKDFTDAFHPRIVGLTGTMQQIADTAKAYRVYYKKVPYGDSYLMDHSAITYVMGPDGKFVTHFSHQTSPDQMATTLRALLTKSK